MPCTTPYLNYTRFECVVTLGLFTNAVSPSWPLAGLHTFKVRCSTWFALANELWTEIHISWNKPLRVSTEGKKVSTEVTLFPLSLRWLQKLLSALSLNNFIEQRFDGCLPLKWDMRGKFLWDQVVEIQGKGRRFSQHNLAHSSRMLIKSYSNIC